MRDNVGEFSDLGAVYFNSNWCGLRGVLIGTICNLSSKLAQKFHFYKTNSFHIMDATFLGREIMCNVKFCNRNRAYPTTTLLPPSFAAFALIWPIKFS